MAFYLSFTQLLDKQADSRELNAIARARRDQMRLFNKTPTLAARLTTAALELASSPFAQSGASSNDTRLGSWVSGKGPITGRAYVVDYEETAAGSPLEGFRSGDILLCSMVHPMWLDPVLKSAGVVAEVGGWLSHMSIVARENGVPMLVGADNLQQFETGQILEIMENGELRPAEVELPAKAALIAE